jgi:hypothetical protein
LCGSAHSIDCFDADIGQDLSLRIGESMANPTCQESAPPMTRQEIEQKMDESAREYHETHDPEIPEEIFELAKWL